MIAASIPHSAPRAAGDLVEHLMTLAFNRPRAPRSAAYKAGARALLYSRATQSPLARLYAPGTAEFDAFHAGVGEGREIWSSQMRKESQC